MAGFEPATSRFRTERSARLSYTPLVFRTQTSKTPSGRPGSNRRPPASKAGALPLRYTPLHARTDFEPCQSPLASSGVEPTIAPPGGIEPRSPSRRLIYSQPHIHSGLCPRTVFAGALAGLLLKRPAGLEPASPDWQSGASPLGQGRKSASTPCRGQLAPRRYPSQSLQSESN